MERLDAPVWRPGRMSPVSTATGPAGARANPYGRSIPPATSESFLSTARTGVRASAHAERDHRSPRERRRRATPFPVLPVCVAGPKHDDATRNDKDDHHRTTMRYPARASNGACCWDVGALRSEWLYGTADAVARIAVGGAGG